MNTFFTPRHRLHDPAEAGLEEVPARAEIIAKAVQTAALGDILPPSDHGLEPILAIHASDYITFLQEAFAAYTALYPSDTAAIPGTFAPPSARRHSRHIYGQLGTYSFGVGSPILKDTWTAAYWSAQCALSAADDVLTGTGAAYALCRPPGHHAARALSGGFCYLNNAAIAARYLQRRQPGATVAILDVDYHHGNGTQEIFYADGSVLYVSLHAHPDDDYPYFWGEAEESGEGLGAGCNLNIPLPPKIGDAAYEAALSQGLAIIRGYRPAFLVVSLGLDIFCGDPVGGFAITRAGLGRIGRRIAGLELPTVVVQEGGYLLENLGENAVAFLQPIAG